MMSLVSGAAGVGGAGGGGVLAAINSTSKINVAFGGMLRLPFSP